MQTYHYNVMGIDPSLKSLGVAIIGGEDGKVMAWHDGYALTRKSGHIKNTRRLLHLACFVVSKAVEHNVGAIAMERATFGLCRMDLFSVMNVINAQLYLRLGTVPIQIGTPVFYKYFLGKWNRKTDKDGLANVLKSRYGYDLANSDEYDAAGIARLIYDNRFGPRDNVDVHKTIDAEFEQCGLVNRKGI